MESSKYMTKFEKVYIIGLRAEQIKKDHLVPRVPVTGTNIDYSEIAERELKEKKLGDMYIIRHLPNGRREKVNVNSLIILE